MLIIFFSILLIAAFIAFVIYRYQGRVRLLKIDAVQFVYLFVLAPAIFVWLKSFIFFSLREEILFTLTFGQFFVLDTFLSVIGLYMFGILAIHTITKVFWLEKYNNPMVDIYELSEYFHLWWSHILMYVSGLVLITILAFINVLVPLPNANFPFARTITSVIGIIFGLMMYVGIWNSDPKQSQRSFMKIMHLCFILIFLIHMFMYYLMNPAFRAQYAFFWFSFFTFLSSVLCLLILPKLEIFDILRGRTVHPGWGNNIDIFHRHHADKK